MAYDSFVGVGKAAKILGCSRQYVQALLKAGRIPGAQMIAGRWLMKDTALQGITIQGRGKRKA